MNTIVNATINNAIDSLGTAITALVTQYPVQTTGAIGYVIVTAAAYSAYRLYHVHCGGSR